MGIDYGETAWDVEYLVEPYYMWFPFIWFNVVKLETSKYLLKTSISGNGLVQREQKIRIKVSKKEAEGFVKLLKD